MRADQQETEAIERSGTAAMLAAACISAVLAGGFYLWLVHAQRYGNETIVLDSTINVNTEPVASLVRLNAIGPVRAEAIEKYRREHGIAGSPAFKTAADLEKIKGIGAKTVDKFEQYIRFE